MNKRIFTSGKCYIDNRFTYLTLSGSLAVSLSFVAVYIGLQILHMDFPGIYTAIRLCETSTNRPHWSSGKIVAFHVGGPSSNSGRVGRLTFFHCLIRFLRMTLLGAQ
jgi:hypothetical protein